MAVEVLFVCTGNVCRSPMAERLLRARLHYPGAELIHTCSAGTHALVGYAMDRPSALVLRELGGDADGHVARRLTRDLVAAADLVLTSDSANRGEVVRANPLALRRTFTMREFARLGAARPAGDRPGTVDALIGRVADVAAQRGRLETPPPGADEIGDPFGAPLEVVRACGHQVDAAVDGILAALGL